jgi:hypothetical protein
MIRVVRGHDHGDPLRGQFADRLQRPYLISQVQVRHGFVDCANAVSAKPLSQMAHISGFMHPT